MAMGMGINVISLCDSHDFTLIAMMTHETRYKWPTMGDSIHLEENSYCVAHEALAFIHEQC